MNMESCIANMYTRQPMKLFENVESSAKNPSSEERARTWRFGRFLPVQGGLNIRWEQ